MKSLFINIDIYTILVILSICISSCKKEKKNGPILKHLNPDLIYGEVSDVEGNKYATIIIGNQTWMAENLRTSLYANGDSIPNYTVNREWNDLTSSGWANYNNDKTYDLLVGKLYNWYAIKNPKNICPNGWHVPTDEEWSILTAFLGGPDVAGQKMKSKLTEGWATEYEGQITRFEPGNESGFSAIASGSRNIDGQFSLKTYRATFWSTTEYSDTEAYSRGIFWNGNSIEKFKEYKRYGFSCRCIKD